jgi:hypothetical protein
MQERRRPGLPPVHAVAKGFSNPSELTRLIRPCPSRGVTLAFLSRSAESLPSTKGGNPGVTALTLRSGAEPREPRSPYLSFALFQTKPATLFNPIHKMKHAVVPYCLAPSSYSFWHRSCIVRMGKSDLMKNQVVRRPLGISMPPNLGFMGLGKNAGNAEDKHHARHGPR